MSGVWDTIALEAERESPVWADALLPDDRRERLPVFSPLAAEPFALGLETIYEGYLVHYGRARLFAPPDGDAALLLGDYLYAHGLVRIAAVRDVDAVADLATLIAVCAQLRADGAEGDGPACAATAALLGSGGRLAAAMVALRDREEAAPVEALAAEVADAGRLEKALAAHASRVG